MYYARSENSNGERETVRHHLLRTAELAAANGADFGCWQEGEIEGLLHDLGKYSQAFQDVLNGKQTRINHAAAGSLVALQKYKKSAMPIAMAIFAHHSWLESDIEPVLLESQKSDGPCYDNQKGKMLALSGAKKYQEGWKAFSSEIDLPRVSLQNEKYDYCSNINIAYMMHVRMLFSALVDADYCASAEHFEPDYLKECTGSPLDAGAVLERLAEYRRQLAQKSTADTKINQIRGRLFQDCVDAAKHPPGLFTLTAPTGTGKTLSLFAFALEHAKAWQKKRIILVLPFLAIIQQNASIYRTLAEDLLEDHSQSNLDEETRLFAERWSAPVIVTTSVKFFQSLFSSHPADCRKLHNIANSVIVFDEAQSIPPHLTGATLDAVNALCGRYGCSIVFSTATQPSFDYRPDIHWKPTEIVKDPAGMFQETRRVKVEWNVESPVSLSEIAYQMAREENCCTIVNLRSHARELFSQLNAQCDDAESLFYITTDLCVAHRQEVLRKINERLSCRLPCRLVSTQCIEAGVDLDFQTVFRALAPLEAIIQAAGRCNRNGRGGMGRVAVFVPDCQGNLYPDTFYEAAANKVKFLLERHPIDISDLNHIDEYYRLLYQDSLADDKQLLESISAMDFLRTEEKYQLIKTSGVNVIVPYDKILFQEIKEETLKNGLTPKLMQKARPITVSSFELNNVKEFCEALPFHTVSGRYQPADSNWYLLDEDSAYQQQTGLNFQAAVFSGIV